MHPIGNTVVAAVRFTNHSGVTVSVPAKQLVQNFLIARDISEFETHRSNRGEPDVTTELRIFYP